MACFDEDEKFGRVKPLDELLEDNLMEFESGEETQCDRELDDMIWKLGDYENEEPPQEADAFAEAPLPEEELVEKVLRRGRDGRAEFREADSAEPEAKAGGKLGDATAIGLGRARKSRTPATGLARKKKSRSRGIAA